MTGPNRKGKDEEDLGKKVEREVTRVGQTAAGILGRFVGKTVAATERLRQDISEQGWGATAEKYAGKGMQELDNLWKDVKEGYRTVGAEMGKDLERITEDFRNYAAPNGRLNVLKAKDWVVSKAESASWTTSYQAYDLAQRGMTASANGTKKVSEEMKSIAKQMDDLKETAAHLDTKYGRVGAKFEEKFGFVLSPDYDRTMEYAASVSKRLPRGLARRKEILSIAVENSCHKDAALSDKLKGTDLYDVARKYLFK